jgi:hypothetical protein
MTFLASKPPLFLRLGLIGLYFMAALWVAVRAGSPDSLWWWALSIPFLAWIVSPVAVPLLMRMNNWFLTAGVTVIAIHGVYEYERGMFGPDTNSTSAVMFVFLPAYQWAAAALLIFIAALVDRRAAK